MPEAEVATATDRAIESVERKVKMEQEAVGKWGGKANKAVKKRIKRQNGTNRKMLPQKGATRR